MDFKTYEKHLSVLNEKIGMPQKYSSEILNMCRKICENNIMSKCFSDIQERFFRGSDETYNEIIKLAEENDLEKHMLVLTFCEMYSLHTLELYKWRRYPMSVYYDSFIDLVIWGNVCLKEHGVFGISNYGWVAVQIRADMFRIGRLQFHYVEYESEVPYTHAGVTVKKGDKVINMHIPEGDALTKEKRINAYRGAYKFFGQTGNAVFVCNSWLLYPGHTDFLHSKSNILDFMKDFEIISHIEHFDRFDDKWRVFGFLDSYDPQVLPRETTLMRSYADRLASGGELVQVMEYLFLTVKIFYN